MSEIKFVLLFPNLVKQWSHLINKFGRECQDCQGCQEKLVKLKVSHQQILLKYKKTMKNNDNKNLYERIQ